MIVGRVQTPTEFLLVQYIKIPLCKQVFNKKELHGSLQAEIIPKQKSQVSRS